MVPNVASSNLVTRPIKSKNGPKGPFFNLTKTVDQMRTESSTTSKRAKRSAGDLLGVPRSHGTQSVTDERIREYTIRKIIKTEFVNTSFYRFLLLRIEDWSPAFAYAIAEQSGHPLPIFTEAKQGLKIEHTEFVFGILCIEDWSPAT